MATPGGRISPDLIAAWLASPVPINSLKSTPTWAGLVTSDPFATSDPLSVEILGDAYRRPPFPYQSIQTVLCNLTPLHWSGIAPLSRVLGIAGFASSFGGGLLWYTPLPDPLDFPAGGSLDFPEREIYIGIDA